MYDEKSKNTSRSRTWSKSRSRNRSREARGGGESRAMYDEVKRYKTKTVKRKT